MLYELAAGKPAFRRGSAAETMTAIIRRGCRAAARYGAPASAWIVERLLHKEPGERYDSTRDLYRELRQLRDRLSESVSASAVPAVAAGRKRRLLPGVGLAAGLVALGAGMADLFIRPAPADLSAYKFTAISRDEATERYPAWSPDGKTIAYTANIHGTYQVFTKALGASDTAQLTHATASCAAPAWSPDGATIYYSSGGGLWAVGASGGASELVMEKAARSALDPDGKTLVFLRGGKTWIAPLKGGAPKELVSAPRGVITRMLLSRWLRARCDRC